jgi:hypothetical protein
MNSLEIDYEEMIKEIKEQNPNNYTELIYSILAITGVGWKRKHVWNTLKIIEMIKPLDEQLRKITYIKGELIGHKSRSDYNRTHNIKIDLS